MVSYHIKYQKTNDPILRKFSDRRTDGQIDIKTDESGFIGRRPTKVERPNIVHFIGRSILNANQI